MYKYTYAYIYIYTYIHNTCGLLSIGKKVVLFIYRSMLLCRILVLDLGNSTSTQTVIKTACLI